MRPRLIAGSCLALLALASPVVCSSGSAGLALSRTSDLASTPDGARVGVLLPGAPVKVIETRDRWIRVTVEGWILADDLEGGVPAAVPAAAPLSVPIVAPALAKIAGSVYVTGEGGKTILGSGLAVRLLENSEDIAGQIADINDECHTRRSVLSDKAAAFADQAERAMKTISGTSEAFEAYDQAKQQRARTLKEIKALDAECGTKLEAAVESRTVSRTLTGPDGRYSFDGVRPAFYVVHVIMEAEGMRHEWDARADTRESVSLTLDLTPANRSTYGKIPTYR